MNPSETDLKNTLRILRNICQIVDAHQFTGVNECQAAVEAGQFLTSMLKQTEEALKAVQDAGKPTESKAELKLAEKPAEPNQENPDAPSAA
jgi:hypothetical protein